MKEFSRRSLLKAGALSLAYSFVGGKAFGASLSNINTVIGRPTNSTIALSLIAGNSANCYIEFGYKPTALLYMTPSTLLSALTPKIIEINSLKANSQIFYRVRSKTGSDPVFAIGETNSFFTQRKTGSAV